MCPGIGHIRERRLSREGVAKASGMGCTRAPDPSRPGARRSTVWEVPATMNAVLVLAARLAPDDAALRRTLDAHEVLRLELTGEPMPEPQEHLA